MMSITLLGHILKKSIKWILNNSLCVLVIYILVALFIFRNIAFSPGAIIGADWSFPVTQSQSDVNFYNSLYTWYDQGMLFGTRQSIFTPVPFHVFNKAVMAVGIPPDVYTRVMLIAIFVLSAFSMFVFLKKIRINQYSAILSGIIYITTPIFFNYAVMGWTFVLIYLAILPWMVWFTMQSVRTGNIRYPILIGLLFAFSIIQSQSAIWTPIIFFILGFYLIKDRRSLFLYIRTMLIVFVLFFGLNFYWISGLLLIPDKNISGSDIVTSSVSLGTMGHFRPTNIIRLFGSLFNFQYELSIGNSPTLGQKPISLLSFTLPVIVFLSLFIKTRKRLIRTFWLIALFPVAVYFLNYYRQILLYVPYTNVLRDFARFIIMSAFAYTVLAGIVFDHFLKQNKKITAFVLSVLLIISVFPWWSGEISWWEHRTLADVRLRTEVFPHDYIELENKFKKIDEDINIIYFPTNSILDLTDNEKFHGINGTVDVFAAFSPKAGSIYTSDRSRGYLGPYLKLLNSYLDPHFDPKFMEALRLTNIKYIVFRKNAYFPNSKDILQTLEENKMSGKLTVFYESDNLIVYEKASYYPRIYTSNQIGFVPGIFKDTIDDQSDIVIYAEQNNNNFKSAQLIDFTKTPQLSFRKINPTQYVVNIKNAKNWFPIVLNQTFHDQWQLAGQNSFGDIYPLKTAYHFLSNGWSNAWLVDPHGLCQHYNFCHQNSDGSYDLELIIQFYPQTIFLISAKISIVILTSSLLVLLASYLFKK